MVDESHDKPLVMIDLIDEFEYFNFGLRLLPESWIANIAPIPYEFDSYFLTVIVYVLGLHDHSKDATAHEPGDTVLTSD